jgi:penicillin-binding protein 1A
MLDCPLGSAGVASLPEPGDEPSLRLLSPPPSCPNRQSMASPRRKEPRPGGDPEPQENLGDGSKRERFAESSEVEFDFSGEAEFIPGRPATPGGEAGGRSVGGVGDEIDPAEEPSTAGNGTGSAPVAPGRDRRATRVERERPPSAAASPPGSKTNGSGNGKPPGGVIPPPPPPAMPSKRNRPRLKKIRFLFVLVGLGLLASVSMVFGMMAAVSQDLPAIYDFAKFKASKNSVVFDSTGEKIGTLTSNQNKILLGSGQISTNVKNAVVSIEDSRFYEHNGVDFQGIGRALVQDVLSQSAQQGASTITEQFVKSALTAQGSRTILQKFREAALAYRLERHWTKDKILTEYLNTIYFGEGAYGIEAAASTYFGSSHPGCGTTEEPCASVLYPWEAAMLAGIIASPSVFDPKLNPETALARRNLVLEKMKEQGYITEADYTTGIHRALPTPEEIQPPTLDSKAPYFTSWLRQQLVDKYGPTKAFFGGLKIKSTLDLQLQDAAQGVVSSYLGGIAPTAAVVVINNKNAAVKTMVAGPNYETKPFNLATQGYRQPGSSIKPFILTTALRQGISPYTVYASAPQLFHFGKDHKELFPVSNYGDSYLGSADIVTATQYSDNSVYSQIGLANQFPGGDAPPANGVRGGTHAIAHTIHDLGVSDHISTNPAMVLGGLDPGVTPLQWTYAFSSIANDGVRVSGNLAPDPGDSPVAYTSVKDENGDTIKDGDNDKIKTRVVPAPVAQEAKSILHNVVTGGTGIHANIGDPSEWGKTGTTENNGDAWFCGAVTDVTACVWVGYADSNTPMTTEYGGAPVDGGTFPALIWAGVISAWEQIRAERGAAKGSDSGSGGSSSTYVPAAPSTSAPSTSSPAPSAPAPSPAPSSPAPSAPAPAAPAPSSPAPAAPSGGSSGGASPG